jgi:hypothetical protein
MQNKQKMKTHYSELLEDFLIKEGYQYFGNNEKSNFILEIQGLNGSWKNNLSMDNCDGQIIVRCISPIKVFPDKIHSMINLLCRINSEFIFGHYTIDFEDGEISLLMSMSLLDNNQPETHIRQLAFAAFKRFDKYLPAIMSVNYTDTHPLLIFIETHSKSL